MSNYCLDLAWGRLLAPALTQSAVPRPISHKAPIRVIRFTRRIARQCSLARWQEADRDVCDAIANGTRRVVRRRGSLGGPVILFENRPKPEAGRKGTAVRVLGELTRGGCVALLLLPPFSREAKNSQNWGFLNRACSK